MDNISIEQIKDHIQTNIGSEYDIIQDLHGVYNIRIPINQLYRLIHFLYKDELLGFKFLTTICAVHYPNREGHEFDLVYHVQSMYRKLRMRIKTSVPLIKPEAPSITGIYASADWMERETYDFFGIEFLGHPNLKRILNMDEMIGFPMRKEFPLEDPLREDKADFHFGR